MREDFGFALGCDLANDDDYLRLPIAGVIADIARAAAGETDGLNRGEVYDAVQLLLARLSALPGEAGFWYSQFGEMTALAYAWSRSDRLITISEAARLSGRSVAAISEQVRKGGVASYADMSEPNPRRRTRVMKSDFSPR